MTFVPGKTYKRSQICADLGVPYSDRAVIVGGGGRGGRGRTTAIVINESGKSCGITYHNNLPPGGPLEMQGQDDGLGHHIEKADSVLLFYRYDKTLGAEEYTYEGVFRHKQTDSVTMIRTFVRAAPGTKRATRGKKKGD